MRADRLVAVLLLLQQRGKVTAAEVAAELEVSERTARRDLEALGLAGLPVYAVQGRNGGWRLAGGGRTDLSGLTSDEARALFLVAGPSATATPEVRAALRKLVRALPEPLRDRAEAASSAVVVDPAGWDRPAGGRPPPPHLDDLQRAVVDGGEVRLGYVARDGAPSTRPVRPLGLVAKGAVWYLVADTEAGRRTFRVDRVRDVEPTGEPAPRPLDFDLATEWQRIAGDVEALRAPLRARGLADPDVLPYLRYVLGTRVAIGPVADDGRASVELRGHSVRALAAELAGFGGSLEVVEPAELREVLAAVGQELVARYG